MAQLLGIIVHGDRRNSPSVGLDARNPAVFPKLRLQYADTQQLLITNAIYVKLRKAFILHIFRLFILWRPCRSR